MRLGRGVSRLLPKLLLSYLLIVAVTVAVLAAGMLLIGPSLFDRLLEGHADAHHDMMGAALSDEMRDATERSFREALFQSIILTAAVATVAAVAVSVFVSRRIAGPIADLARVSRRIARGNYSGRVPVGDRQDELGEFAASFNEMAAALEDAEQRRMRVIGDVAHEIRTPLATLGGYLEALADGVVEPGDELFGLLRAETSRLQRLVDDLQELSRAEAGAIELSLTRTTPSRLVDGAVGAFALSFASKGVELTTDVAAGLPDVVADERRSIQVIGNLLSNALRHTPAGGHVRISAARAGGHVSFTVTDTGSGIAAEHVPHVFDRFYRADPGRARDAGGSGIGLTIARALVAEQGGRIFAESAGPGRGSAFTFTLPVVTG